jgi:DNA transformation protein and related proteins
MSIDEGLYAWVQEALDPLGAVTKRSMMGGATLYLDGIVFAIMDEGELYFKADAETDAMWDAEGAARFTFDMGGKTGSMNYRRAPAEAYDDAEEMQRWARLAVAAGQRAAAKKKPRTPRKRPGSPDRNSP